MRYDAKNPHYHNNDRFILSKGHAAPLLYAAWAETGLFPAEELLKLRQLGSDLEGHPTPRLSFADVATGPVQKEDLRVLAPLEAGKVKPMFPQIK